MRVGLLSRAAAGLAIVCLCLVEASPGAATSIIGTDLSVPGRSSATPSIAAAGDLVAAAWGAALPSGATDVFVAVSRDSGRTFGAPARVSDSSGDVRVNGEQPPRVTIAPDLISVVWTAKGERGTKLLASRSTDAGRTFGKPAVVPGSDAPGNRGWENVASNYVVWLDHRGLAKQDGEVAASHHDHAAMPGSKGKPDGVAMAQKSKLYVAALDGDTSPVVVTGGVCYCCKTAITVRPDGAVAAAWRHVYAGNIRDIAFSMSRDGGRTFAPPVRVSEDRWVLEGCPDDGPAMAVDGSNRIHIVWPTLVKDGDTETIALFYATSIDGKRFTARERIPAEGMPHHPQIAIGADGTPVMAWDEAANGSRRAVMARVSTGEQRPVRFAREPLGDGAVYPVVAAARAATVVAWTNGKSPTATIRVEVRP